jgi:uncharacterized lipoprotein YmbA
MAYLAPPSCRLRRLGLCVVAVALVALSVSGCVRLLEPRTSDATYYLLSPPQDEVSLPSDTTGLAVGLRAPRMASYLAATRLVTRRGPHQIRFSEFHRWAEDLDQGISRTLAQTLAAQDSIRSVEVVPWPKGTTFDYIVQLHVLRFEGVGPRPDPETDEDSPPPEGHSLMVVEWKILDAKDDTVLERGLTRHRTDGWSVGNYETLASRLGTGLATLADDIGAQLKSLARP